MTKELRRLSLAEIKPYENNPRNNDGAVEAVAESIRQCEYIAPIVVDEEGVILAGHTRLKALQRLEKTEADVLIVSGLTEAQKRKYRLLDNKTNELADWNFDLLTAELEGLDFDGFDFGFGPDADAQDPEDIIEDEPPEPPEKPKSKIGDIYQLGRHRLMCGDSTDKAALDKLMNGDKAVFVFTDPPYGVAIGDKNKRLNAVAKGGRIQENIEGDAIDRTDLYDMLVKAMTNLREHCSQDCSYYVTSPQGGDLGPMMMMMMRDAGLAVRHQLIWVKNNFNISLGLDYCYRHEPIFYTWTDKHNFYGGWSDTVIDDTTPIDKMSKAELKDLVRALRQDRDDSVIYCDKPQVNDLHPTMKPIKLIARFMINSSQKGDSVLDIFGGSGSALMAAEQLGRTCYMMELDPKYVDVIIKRYEDFTGDKAVKVDEL